MEYGAVLTWRHYVIHCKGSKLIAFVQWFDGCVLLALRVGGKRILNSGNSNVPKNQDNESSALRMTGKVDDT